MRPVSSFGMAAFIASALLQAPGYAFDETPPERDCRLFIDQVSERIRAGDMSHRSTDVPRLKACDRILKASLDRESRKIVDGYDQSQGRKAPPHR